MRIVPILSVAILAGACARQDVAPAQDQAQPKERATMVHPRGAQIPADCPLRIDFGSYAMGIDRDAAAAIERILAGDGAVTGVETFPWGREGEKTLCVRVRSDADAERLARAISRTFPAEPRGPLSVTTQSGLRFSAGHG